EIVARCQVEQVVDRAEFGGGDTEFRLGQLTGDRYEPFGSRDRAEQCGQLVLRDGPDERVHGVGLGTGQQAFDQASADESGRAGNEVGRHVSMMPFLLHSRKLSGANHAERRVSPRNATSASTPNSAMVNVIGSAVSLPPSETSGAEIPPIANWNTPSRAAAEPAVSGWPASASDIQLGMTSPTLDTTKPSGISRANMPSWNVAARTIITAPRVATLTPVANRPRSVNRPTSRALTCPITTMPIPPAPNTKLYVCALRPNTSCSTNDEPEM